MLGSGNEPKMPVSHVITRKNNQYSAAYCVAIVFLILCLCFCISSCLQNSHLCLLLSDDEKGKAITLGMKSEMIVTLKANVNVLSILKVGSAKLCCLVGEMC